MQFKAYTDKGYIRERNEDNHLLKLDPYPVVVVADGMGGHRAGKIASKIAVESIDNYDFNFDYTENILDEIKEAVILANNQIIEKGRKNPSQQGMGTTISLAIVYNKKLFIGHVGDSRIYLYRNKQLERITTDDSLVNELIKKGKISPEDAFDHPQKHILTQALGLDEHINIEVDEISLKQGDILLFCTDGLTDMLREEEISKIVNSYNSDIEILAKKLGDKALENGGNDNVTLITGIIN